MKTSAELCIEATGLGREAIRTAFKANALSLADPQRWPLSRRILAIDARLKAIAAEINLLHTENADEDCTVS